MANGHVVEYDIVGPVAVKFKNRRSVCHAMVLQGDNEPLLGAIPLEDLDVIIHPQRQELIVNPEHPNFAQMRVKKLSANKCLAPPNYELTRDNSFDEFRNFKW